MKAHILIVDDVPSNLMALADLLSEQYEIRIATGGEDALQAAASGEPIDLILLDVLMPDLDGYAVCRELKRRESSRDIPVIFITAKDEVEDETYGFEVGAADYIAKPFDGQVVLARVRNQLAIKARMDALRRRGGAAGNGLANGFARQADHWRVRFQGGPAFVLPDSKGAAYLRLLLSHPGRYFPVEELAFHLSDQERAVFLASARTVLDAKTVAYYAERVRTLQDQRREAEALGDRDELERVQQGMDWIVGELKRAGGLGRQKHQGGLDRERLRKAVGNAMRRCLGEIGQHDPNLAQHLQFPRLRMGYELIYEPADGTRWDGPD